MSSAIPTRTTVADFLLHNADVFGHKPVAIFENKSLSFRELTNRALSLASALRDIEVNPSDRVAILSMNRLEYLEFYAACEISGFIATPLNYRLAVPELSSVIENADPKVIFFESTYATAVQALRQIHTSIEHWIEIGNCSSNCTSDYAAFLGNRASTTDGETASHQVAATDIAYLIHTSGTTGKPKGAMLSHQSQCVTALAIAQGADLNERDLGLIVQPLFHVGAKFLQLAHFVVGATIVLQREFDPAAIWDALSEKKISSLQLAPTMIEMLLAARPKDSLNLHLRTVFYSTAPIRERLLREAIEVFGDVFIQHYGSTEAGVVTTLSRQHHQPDGSRKQQAWLKSAGQPGSGVELKIIDDAGHTLANGETGEILTRHSALFSGYWRDAQATESATENDWLRMGDIGFFDDDQFLYIVDRKKDMIVSGGENIYPREVENVLALHSAVAECSVIGMPDPRWGESIVAEVVLRDGHAVSEPDLIEYCRDRIASYKKPKKVVFRTALPRLANGKIDKVTIRQAYWQDQSRAV